MSVSYNFYLWTGTLEQGPREEELTSATDGAWAKLQYLLLQAKTGQCFTWSKLHLMEPQLPEIKLQHICKNLHLLTKFTKIMIKMVRITHFFFVGAFLLELC